MRRFVMTTTFKPAANAPGLVARDESDCTLHYMRDDMILGNTWRGAIRDLDRSDDQTSNALFIS